jgi:hypothetical protein
MLKDEIKQWPKSTRVNSSNPWPKSSKWPFIKSKKKKKIWSLVLNQPDIEGWNWKNKFKNNNKKIGMS